MGQLETTIAQRAKLYALLSVKEGLSTVDSEVIRTTAEMQEEDIKAVERNIQKLKAENANLSQ